jgi:hypothetical protein
MSILCGHKLQHISLMIMATHCRHIGLNKNAFIEHPSQEAPETFRKYSHGHLPRQHDNSIGPRALLFVSEFFRHETPWQMDLVWLRGSACEECCSTVRSLYFLEDRWYLMHYPGLIGAFHSDSSGETNGGTVASGHLLLVNEDNVVHALQKARLEGFELGSWDRTQNCKGALCPYSAACNSPTFLPWSTTSLLTSNTIPGLFQWCACNTCTVQCWWGNAVRVHTMPILWCYNWRCWQIWLVDQWEWTGRSWYILHLENDSCKSLSANQRHWPSDYTVVKLAIKHSKTIVLTWKRVLFIIAWGIKKWARTTIVLQRPFLAIVRSASAKICLHQASVAWTQTCTLLRQIWVWQATLTARP